jgi:DNA polymerase III sliding clamp (beta) subunit (PCNA family)
MKRALFVLLGVGVALVASARVLAHHSFAATYFEDQTEQIEGNLVQFLFRNPHSFVHVEAKDKDGNMQRYAVEWGAGLQLNRQGVTRETLHPGDHVLVTGNPGRNPADHRLRMKTIVRPSDGWKWGGTFD